MNGAQLLIFVRIITDIFLNLQYSSKNVDAYSLQIKAPKAEYVVTSGKNDKGKYDVTGQHVTTFDLSGDTHYGTSDPTVVNVYSNGGGTRNKSTTNSNKQITGVDVDAYNEVDSENINNIDLSKLKKKKKSNNSGTVVVLVIALIAIIIIIGFIIYALNNNQRRSRSRSGRSRRI